MGSTWVKLGWCPWGLVPSRSLLKPCKASLPGTVGGGRRGWGSYLLFQPQTLFKE